MGAAVLQYTPLTGLLSRPTPDLTHQQQGTAIIILPRNGRIKRGLLEFWLGLPELLPVGPADAIAGCSGLWPNKVTETKIVPLLEKRQMCPSSGERERGEAAGHPSKWD